MFLTGLLLGCTLGLLLGVALVYLWQHSPAERPGSVEFYRRIVKMHQRNYYGNLRGGYRSLAQHELDGMKAAQRDLDAALQREAKATPTPGEWPY